MRDQHSYDRSLDEPAVTQPPARSYYQQPAPEARPAAARSRARLGAVLLLIGVLWLAFEFFGKGFVFGGVGSSTVLDRTAADASRIELEAGSADVEVRTWEGTGIRVEAVQRGGRSGDYTIDFSQSGDGLRVTTQSSSAVCFFCTRDLHYTVLMPSDGQVTVRTSSGDIDLAGVSGAGQGDAPTLSTSSGAIKAHELRNGLTAETSSGDIELGDVAGALNIKSSSGDVQLRDGAVTSAAVETSSGEIDLRGVAGKLELSSTSGDIEVRDARDSLLALKSSSASIVYEGALATGSHTVSTVSGDVTLRLPRDSSFTLQATTVSGDLSLDSFENQNITGSRRELGAFVGRGASQLQIETTSGSVEVQGS
jgi:DUF4097 and DUF4098 domain-containing protein YvlB